MDTVKEQIETPMLKDGAFCPKPKYEVKIEYLPLSEGTQKKLYGKGTSHKVPVFVCRRCSAIVCDKQNHAQFHENIESDIEVVSITERAN